MKNLVILLTFLLLATTFAQGLDGRIVIVGSDTTYPPFETINADGEAEGFDIDLVNAICAKIDCVIDIKTYAWDGMMAAVGAGEFVDFDMIASGVSITAERDETADFSDPYLVVNQAITVAVDNEALTVDDYTAEGSTLTLAAQLGTTNADLALELVGQDRLRTYDDFNSAILALLQGDVDGVIIDGVTADAFVDQHAGDLVVNIRGLSNDPLGLVFPPDSELLDAFNEGLAMIKEDGTLDTLITKWFGE